MRVLVVSAWEPDRADRSCVAHTVHAFANSGHDVTHIDLIAERFVPYMSEAERIAYESDEPLITAETKRSAELVLNCEAVVFCHPVVFGGLPPVLKGWLDRVLVPGVAFVFDNRQKLRPNLLSVRRLAMVTAGDSPPAQRDDLAYRTLIRTLRLNCNRMCRTKRLAISPSDDSEALIFKAFAGW